jgi:hypothetical protein
VGSSQGNFAASPRTVGRVPLANVRDRMDNMVYSTRELVSNLQTSPLEFVDQYR